MIQSKHFDNEYQTYYWHNSVTGQSIWSEDEESFETEQNQTEIFSVEHHASNQENTCFSCKTIPLSTAKSDLTNSIVEKCGDVNLSNSTSERKIRKLPKARTIGMDQLPCNFGVRNSSFDSPSFDSPSYDDSASLWSPSVNREEKTDLSAGADPKIDRDIMNYSICIFINAVLIEGPLAAIEGILRAAIFFTASVFMVLSAGICLKGSFLSYSFMLLRDAFLSLAASITLCFPGTSCLVYRWYRLEDTWELAPIPTIFGWVDSRRFMSFTFGNGCFAKNVRHDDYLYDSHERRGDSDIGGIQYTSSLEQEQIDRNRICYDSWTGVIFMEPRRVQADILRIVRGDDPSGILSSKVNSSTKKYFPVPIKSNDEEIGLSI